MIAFYPPVVAIEPEGLIAVNESSTIQFWCTYDANPMNISEIRWFKDHRPLDFPNENNPNNKIWMSRDERGTPMLTIRNIDRNDSANYKCRIRNKFGATDSITTARLEVAYPPVVSLEIVEPKNQIIEQRSLDVGSSSSLTLPTMTLHCQTLHGNPKQLQTVQWYRNGQHFLTTISFRKLQSQPSPTSSSTLSSLSTTTPSFLHHSFYHRIGTGKHFQLIDESTPLSGPLNGEFLLTPNGTSWLTNLAEPYVHYLNEPEMLTIANVTREHRGNYSCLGFNGAANGSRLSNERQILVKYPPGSASLTMTSNSDTNDRYVLKGSQAVLECRIDDPGDPPAHSIIWTHNGLRIDRATTHFQSPPPIMTSNSIQRNSLIARYRTPKADMTVSGEYRCRAINDLGQGEWGTFRLDVKSPPRILQSLPTTIGALSDQNLTLTCRVECQPPCEIHWFHNNLTRLSPDTRGILPSSPLLTNEYRAKLRNGNELTFSLINEQTEGIQGPTHTWSSITIHNTSMLFDFDQLTCVSSNSDTEELGPPVYSTVVFRREYLPHSVHLSVPGIDLLEGESYPEKPIICQAFGNPQPRYYWTFEPFIPSSSLSLGYYNDNGENHSHHNNQTIVAIGSQLILDKSMAQKNRLKQGKISFESSSSNIDQSSNQINQLTNSGQQQQSSLKQSAGRFYAERTLSGNYTCVATNQHGSTLATLTINVFYRPECELRRINTAKILRNRQRSQPQQQDSSRTDQQPQPIPIMLSCTAISNPAPGKFAWYRRNGSELLEIHPSINSDHSLFVAISQDYDYASDSSGSLFDYYHQQQPSQQHHYQNDDVTMVAGGHSIGGHTRQSIVMGVPSDANLDEYACVVSNAIGESRPCWYEETPVSGQIMSPSSTGVGHSTNIADNGYDNLFMVAASAGLIVFCLVLFAAVAIVFCFHRNGNNRNGGGGGGHSSFKGFGGSHNSMINGGDDDINTPKRLKLNRPSHHLLMLDAHHHSMDHQPLDSVYLTNTIDTNRSKTATLTAGYRMAGNQQLTTPLITGTLTKSSFYNQRQQNHYSTADGSIYGGVAGGDRSNSDDHDEDDDQGENNPHQSASSIMKPFLVSYPSPSIGSAVDNGDDSGGTTNEANPVYAEPEYHCLESSSSGHNDCQLTGSTSVTNSSSGNNSNTSANLQILPPLPPPDMKQRFTLAKFNKQGNNHNHQQLTTNHHHHMEMDSLSSPPANHSNENIGEKSKLSSNSSIANLRKKRPKNKPTTKQLVSSLTNGHHHQQSNSSDYSDSGGDSRSLNVKSDKKSIQNRQEKSKKTNLIEPDYESYNEDDDYEDDDDDDSSVPSTAYQPERDFFFIQNNQNRSQQQTFQNPLSTSSNNNNLSGSSRRRLLPQTTNKYGSLILPTNQLDSPTNQSSSRFINPNQATPQQYHQSPISTRLYYNFDHQNVNPVISSAGNPSLSSPNPFCNSLRNFNNNNWRNQNNNRHRANNNNLMIRQHSDNNQQIGGTSIPPSSSTASCFRRSESTEPLQQQEPPDYHQTILDRFYNEQQQQQRSNLDDHLYG
ncbi:hypothetical protein DERP_003804 [Dermatophagoides pteronyssinus]|uniref:Ig-like domain-containing protein n=1 Tax=Dermatophagoides pteronyssinus TaxID=6956 RepID=A0ABQ8JLP6_DERPT|nr:hypothetical protein DERP_003804 [Dermatophagoides pteronyssinus]